MHQVNLIISGDVQGVGFRSWVKSIAKKFAVAGWVKNREDGCVEILAQGDKKKLQQLVKLCEKGPEVAWVEDVKVKWEDVKEKFEEFEIVK